MKRFPAVILVLTATASTQLGSSLAKGLFSAVTPLVAVWLRVGFAALLLVAVFQPSLRGRSKQQWLAALGYGAALSAMGLSFYLAIAHIPIGMAVTIEFLGPLGVALLSSRRLVDLLWVGLAMVGVVLLGFSPAPLDLRGVLFAALAGVCWGSYILVTPVVARHWEGFSGITIGFVLGALFLVPFAIGSSLNSDPSWVLNPQVWLLGLALGLLNSALPFALEMRALQRMSLATFGILMSLEPAAAAGIALLMLGERLGWVEMMAMVCVVIASIGSVRTSKLSPH